MQLPIADLRLNSLNHPLYEVDVTRSRHQTFDREAVKGVGGERGSALPGAQWLLQPKWAGTNQILYRAEFLQLVPGFFFTDYAMGSAALQEFMGMATNEQLDAHTFYYLVGLDSVTLPASRQGMFMRELDNAAILEAIKVPSLIIQGKDDRIVLSASSDNIARHIPHVSRIDYDHCGHVPSLEAAEQFNRDVPTFMQRVHG